MNKRLITNFKGTPATVKLCEEIAERSNGKCILAFSRGKDSIASWLWLSRFFEEIYTYTYCSVPHLKFVDESLAYYEDFFETKILRLFSYHCLVKLNNLSFQPFDNIEEICEGNIPHFNDGLPGYQLHAKIEDKIRHGLNIDNAWAADGTTIHDSLARKVNLVKDATPGTHSKYKRFYPIYDWTRPRILKLIEQAGVCLPDDYVMHHSSMTAEPNEHLARMLKYYPEDFAKIEQLFPLIRARIARQEIRKLKGRIA